MALRTLMQPRRIAAGLLVALGIAQAPVAAQVPDDLATRLQQARKAMDALTPQQRKLLQQQGVVLPDTATLQGASTQDLAAATGDLVPPRKDAARIARASGTALAPAGLSAYLSDTQARVAKAVRPRAAALGEQIHRDLRAKGTSAAEMGKAAVGLWAFGRVQTALVLMARVCVDEPGDTDNLNNLAAMLSMSGAEERAIPLLNLLDKQFPNNATVLNNLGQAWWGLGDLDQADRYLKAALARRPGHTQANVTRSYIEQARGDKAAAIESMRRAIKTSYSLDRRNRLRKLGYTLQPQDGSAPPGFRADSDPMGLHAFRAPPIPKTADEEAATAAQWEAFGADLQARLAALAQRRQQLTAGGRQAMAQAAAAAAQGRPLPSVAAEAKPPYRDQAVLALDAMDKDGGAAFRERAARTALDELARKLPALRDDYQRERNRLDMKVARQTGEGQPNRDQCPAFQAMITKSLGAYNKDYDERVQAYLQATRLRLNEELFWLQFKETPERFALAQLDRQAAWLGALGRVRGHFRSEDAQACASPAPAKAFGKLADFNDVHCEYHSELNFAGLGVIRSDCNKMSTTLGVGFVKVGLVQDMDREGFADQFLTCSVEVSASVDRSVRAGPVDIGVQAGAAVGVDIGRTGVQDVYVTAQVGASAGKGPAGFDMGAGARVSLVSGAGTVSGTGLLGP